MYFRNISYLCNPVPWYKKQPANFDSGGYSETWLRTLIAEAWPSITGAKVNNKIETSKWIIKNLRDHHYALLQGVPCTIFRGLPTGYGRKEINAIIQDIRIMRNRVSHNEPLCFDNRQFDMTYVKQMYVLISDFFTWINPNIIPTMAQEALDNVQAEIAKTEAIINS